MTLSEGVVHLVEDRDRPAIRAPAKKDGERIEGVAEDAWITQETDPDIAMRQAGGGELRFDPGPQRRSIAGAEIAIPDRVQVEPIVREPPQTPWQFRQFVE